MDLTYLIKVLEKASETVRSVWVFICRLLRCTGII